MSCAIMQVNMFLQEILIVFYITYPFSRLVLDLMLQHTFISIFAHYFPLFPLRFPFRTLRPYFIEGWRG